MIVPYRREIFAYMYLTVDCCAGLRQRMASLRCFRPVPECAIIHRRHVI